MTSVHEVTWLTRTGNETFICGLMHSSLLTLAGDWVWISRASCEVLHQTIYFLKLRPALLR